MLRLNINKLKQFYAFRRLHSNQVHLNASAPPKIALLLGGGGLLPFFWFGLQHSPHSVNDKPWGDALLSRWERHLGISLHFFSCETQAQVRQRFTTYSACILSFLGAVHWGGAMYAPAPGLLSLVQFTWSVLPPLYAWGALNIPETAGGTTN